MVQRVRDVRGRDVRERDMSEREGSERGREMKRCARGDVRRVCDTFLRREGH